MRKQRTPTASYDGQTTIYLAAPFSKLTSIQKTRLITKIAKVVEVLTELKYYVVSPILHNYQPWLRGNLDGSFEFWQGYNLWLLSNCTHLMILTTTGWDTSTGVYAELQQAKHDKKIIEYISPTTYHITDTP